MCLWMSTLKAWDWGLISSCLFHFGPRELVLACANWMMALSPAGFVNVGTGTELSTVQTESSWKSFDSLS